MYGFDGEVKCRVLAGHLAIWGYPWRGVGLWPHTPLQGGNTGKTMRNIVKHLKHHSRSAELRPERQKAPGAPVPTSPHTPGPAEVPVGDASVYSLDFSSDGSMLAVRRGPSERKHGRGAAI